MRSVRNLAISLSGVLENEMGILAGVAGWEAGATRVADAGAAAGADAGLSCVDCWPCASASVMSSPTIVNANHPITLHFRTNELIAYSFGPVRFLFAVLAIPRNLDR